MTVHPHIGRIVCAMANGRQADQMKPLLNRVPFVISPHRHRIPIRKQGLTYCKPPMQLISSMLHRSYADGKILFIESPTRRCDPFKMSILCLLRKNFGRVGLSCMERDRTISPHLISYQKPGTDCNGKSVSSAQDGPFYIVKIQTNLNI